MQEKIDKMLKLKKWVVVGATQNQKKYGYKIYKLLKDNGYKVTPVNPVYDEVDGDKTADNLLEVNKDFEAVSIVVSPKRSEKVVEDAIELGVKNLWFQPGTFTPEIIEKAEDAGIDVVFYDCLLVELKKKLGKEG
ncbi:MAG: CoA-binding protein [Bacillota bacterium]